MILENIHSPEDVRKLTEKEISVLCAEMRDFLVNSVS